MQIKSSEHSLHETIYMVQKGLALVQQLIPVWKQYGPLLKHAPFMVDMIKLMMEDDHHEKTKHSNHDETIKHKTKPSKGSRQDELPKPKLYI